MEKIALPSDWTDGSSAYYPREKDVYIHQPDDLFYHQKLADLWMIYTNEAVPGRKYIFSKLPEGYRIYTKQRSGSLKIDRYIFGHKHGKFDSPNKFFDHFKPMMEERTTHCLCINCAGKVERPIALTDSCAGSNEGDDIYPQLETYFKMCEANPTSEVDIAWERSPQTEIMARQNFREIAPRYRNSLSFLPRKGELVLFYSNNEGPGRFEQYSQQFKLYDDSRRCFRGHPSWRAGVVSHEPQMEVNLTELSIAMVKTDEKFACGIEMFTGPEESEETLSNRTLYIVLNHIRPLSMFHEMLSGIPQNKWHKTIHHALELMCTASIVDPVQFHGRWPRASIECSGVWIGPELLIQGDTVRLLPSRGSEGSPIDTVLIIDEIEWAFENLSLNRNSRIHLRGRPYTIDRDKALDDTPSSEVSPCMEDLPATFPGHVWYPMFKANGKGKHAESRDLSDPDDSLEVPASVVIGRLYEPKAMEFLLDAPGFDHSDLGVQQGRKWAQAKMGSAANSDCTWFLTKDRTEALRISMGYSPLSEQDSESAIAPYGDPIIPQNLASGLSNKRKKQLSIPSIPNCSGDAKEALNYDEDNIATERPGNVNKDNHYPKVNGSGASTRGNPPITTDNASGWSEMDIEENTLWSDICEKSVTPLGRRVDHNRGSIGVEEGRDEDNLQISELLEDESMSDGEKGVYRGKQGWKRPRVQGNGGRVG